MRSTLSNAARQARMGSARATVREFDDDHLMQEVKQADVYHSESPTSFERFQPVGMTAFPIKQQEDPNQKKGQKPKEGETGDWNHDQPTGPAAEAVMLYLNGQRSHPIAFVDDRRVRPYEMSEGEGANYAPDGSEQMVLFKGNGTYVVSLDGKSVKDPKENATRFASLRHVNKKMQTHKIEKKKEEAGGSGGAKAGTLAAAGGQEQKKEKYKHEGDSVNTEVRVTGKRIEFYTGDKLVGHYDKGSNTWELNESGGKFKVIIKGDSIVCQNGGPSKSFMVDNSHVHMKFGAFAIFVDEGGCWSTNPIQIKADPT